MAENAEMCVVRWWANCYGNQTLLETLDESSEVGAQIFMFVYEANLPASTVFVENLITN
jgi:hypothetical protein